MDILNAPVTALNGVGENRAKLLLKHNINSIEDLLYFFPRAMEDRSTVTKISSIGAGEEVCIEATLLTDIQVRKIRSNMTLYSAIVSDDSGSIMITWFNNKYIKDVMHKGAFFRFFGKIARNGGRLCMTSPTYENPETSLHTGSVVPIYPSTGTLTERIMRTVMNECISAAIGNINEYIPENIRMEHQLCEINFALRAIHFPKNRSEYEIARKRLVFEEFLMLQLGILHTRGSVSEKSGIIFETKNSFAEFTKKLPFTFTNAQKRVVEEIFSDLSSGKQMNRLVQGDVGSGKTVVAFAAMYAAYKSGYQSALMAPTEVLASQHYKSALSFFPEEEIALLTGSITGKKKQEALDNILSGKAKIVIGTHAVIENNVEFKNLALVITDEQHRFGVRQRAALADKGNAHILIMSATPIPRTLALILYGDLDISAVDELPPGRQKVDTFAVGEHMRERINRFMVKNLDEGRQIYIICPLVEESEKLDITAAMQLAESLASGVLKNYKVKLLHGKMRPKEKNEIMQSFASGETQVLVSTTVIEVGVNVPNATVMIVENAERFGLSQLHQIRGRVGRGSEKSYCILFSDNPSEQTRQRLDVMCATNDGFEIARRDLELRGPGDFLGTRQHGLPMLKIANLFTDMAVFRKAQGAAEKIYKSDRFLEKYEHLHLKNRLNRMFKENLGTNIIG